MLYLGIDVAKAKLDCCLLQDADTLKRKTKVVANTPAGFALLLEWLSKQSLQLDEIHLIMEATGVYHETAAMFLADAGLTVSIINPAQVKDFGRGLAVRTKTDGVDSVVLARYGALLKPEPWQPPPPAARALTALIARRDAVAEDLQRELNRQEKCLSTRTHALILESIAQSIVFLQAELKRLQQAIDTHIDHDVGLKQDRQLLESIPGVGERVGNHLLAVMHSHHFNSAEQLAAYLGLVPVERQSGSSVLGKARLSKAGPARVRAVLFMAAVVAKQWNPHVKALYERLIAKGKSKMSALGAAMRKLVHLCFGVVKTQTPYDANYAKCA